MKISKLFHWLYFAVMMLPLMVYPIFALQVRSDNGFQPISITVGDDVTETLHLNQLVQNGLPTSAQNWSDDQGSYDINYSTSDDIPSLIIYGEEDLPFDLFTRTTFDNSNYINEGDKFLFIFDGKCDDRQGNCSVSLSYYGDILIEDSLIFNNDGTFKTFSYFGTYIVDDPSSSYNLDIDIICEGAFAGETYSFNKIQCFDLTKIFGSGFEPSSLSDFKFYFPDDYYDFTLDTPVVNVIGSSSVTYNDTDVGSQMVYVGYKVVDNYFNYDNVFNFGSLYTWLEVNFFNGGAPLGFFIFWHLLIYWLLTSLLWLLFDVLLYVPNLIHRWLDKASLS